jgi:hypothetical protein
MLSKVRVDNYIPILENMILHPSLVQVMRKYFIPNSTYFTSGSCVINDKSDVSFIIKDNDIKIIKKLDRIKFKIGNLYIWKSIDSFHQNNMLISQDIYDYINKLLKLNSTKIWLGIGGEFMLYFLNHRYTSNIYPDKYIGITNSYDILEDAEFNESLHHINIKLELVDYNIIDKYPILDNKTSVVIQVSCITQVLIDFLINNKFIQNIIIINCHKKDYDKKTIKLKTKFKQILSNYWMNGNNLVGIYLWILK